ncbi:hypothetical protein AKJ09_10716 [Labilithrix luteola]|uniref:Uncharacterized protein n=1 Tax=Labilithrix luteola TaxID=1391654 RepID=A0A0K1QE98_9BACT|nr:hypothetical protein AKJ09_10716 [Labilithrix luteola]
MLASGDALGDLAPGLSSVAWTAIAAALSAAAPDRRWTMAGRTTARFVNTMAPHGTGPMESYVVWTAFQLDTRSRAFMRNAMPASICVQET